MQVLCCLEDSKKVVKRGAVLSLGLPASIKPKRRPNLLLSAVQLHKMHYPPCQKKGRFTEKLSFQWWFATEIDVHIGLHVNN